MLIYNTYDNRSISRNTCFGNDTKTISNLTHSQLKPLIHVADVQLSVFVYDLTFDISFKTMALGDFIINTYQKY